MQKFISALIFFVCFYTLAKSQTCEKGRQSYLFKTFVVTCKNIQNQFPNTTSVASSISCENCSIPTFSENVVAKFEGTDFDVSNSQIKNITENAFKNFGNSLRRLIFSKNQISYIAPHVFDKFTGLEEVNFKNNNLHEIPPEVFGNLTYGTLDLSNNKIVDITNVLRNVKALKINLSFNTLTTIPDNVFNETYFWTSNKYKQIYHELNLGDNLIEVITSNSFKFGKGNGLRNLYLQNNKISTIPNNTFTYLTELRNLVLDGNKIEILEIDSFSGLTNLVSLSLAKNTISNLKFGIFSKLEHLESLNLESNQLSSLDPTLFSGLIFLTRLYLAHNKISELTPSTIFPLGKLTLLDISDNRLRDLDLKTIYSHQIRLNTVIINDNFWTCSKLVKMYKIMNAKWGGFHSPAKHFDVPNLHGIACSRVELDYDENMDFKEFLNIISQDRVFEDIYDSRINNEGDLNNIEMIRSVGGKITGIFWMILCVTFMCTVVFARFIFVSIKTNKVIANKLNFAYSRAQDENVQLM